MTETKPMPHPTPLRQVLRSATQTIVESGLAQWMTSGARLLETARARLLKAEHDYELGRARIIADAQRALVELKTRTSEQLRDYEAGAEQEIDQLRSEISRLEMMRDAGGWPQH